MKPPSAPGAPAPTITLQRALLVTVGLAILAGIVPAGIVLDRRLALALETRARDDLSLAPRVLSDRSAANADAMMMRAKDLSHTAALADALARSDRRSVQAFADSSRATLGDLAIVIGPDGSSWAGPAIDASTIAETRAGKMPVVVQRDARLIRHVALAPVERNGQWIGAAGLVAPVNNATAGGLSGLTRSDVLIITSDDGMVAATTLDSATTRELAFAVRGWPLSGGAREVIAGGKRRLAIVAPLGGVGVVVFARTIADELAVLPEIRRVAFISAVGALCLALLLGGVLATRVTRPVRQLASASAALAEGQFDAPLPESRIREVERVASTFDVMRQALAARLAELHNANATLTDRNARLTALQADLMQRDRLTATGRLVTQLAHEIRNPVANLRNCLELIRRRVGHDAEAREFTDLAIDELLRMHELAEQMLDVNRPRDARDDRCSPARVAREVARLSALGVSDAVRVHSDIAEETEVQLAADSLKQILLNIVQNAREAMRLDGSGSVSDLPPIGRVAPTVDGLVDMRITRVEKGERSDVAIEILDDGPGIPPAILTRIFDPFFTTKDAVHGVGLGLFVAEGLVRTAGGRLSAGNRAEGGAWFRVELPLATSPSGASLTLAEHSAVESLEISG